MRKRKAEKLEASPCGGDDRLSSLPDHLLGLILSFLPTTQAVATSRLSRRWRHVWPDHARALNLRVQDFVCRGAGPRFCTFSRGALARFPTLGIPAISIEIDLRVYVNSPWYTEAMERATGSVRIRVPRGVNWLEFPLCTGAQALALRLTHLVDLELPVPGPPARPVYVRLQELSLSVVLLAPGTPPFHEFMTTSRFPCLRILRLCCVSGDAVRRLVLSMDTLEVLHLNNVDGLEVVDVASPSLRSLSVRSCFRFPSPTGGCCTTELVVSAPRLEAVCWYRSYPQRLRFLTGMASVRRLSGLKLPAVGRTDQFDFPYTLQLMQACSFVQHLGVNLVMPDETALLNSLRQVQQGPCDELVSYVPQLPNVSVLSLTISWGIGGNIVPSLASLLSRLPSLTRLYIDASPYCFTVLEGQGAVPPREQYYQWGGVHAGHEKIQPGLDSLHEISIDGLKGMDGEECRVMELLLGDPPPSLKRVSLTFRDTATSIVDEIAVAVQARFSVATGRWTRHASSVIAWTRGLLQS